MEKRDLYDENKQKTGEVIEKGQKVPKGRYYITVVVWMQNSKGKFLIQRTVPEKYHMWSTTGGHPKAGESSLEGIVTEIKEELGLSVSAKELKLFKTIKTEDDFVDIYYLKIDVGLDEITIQEEEVEDVKWASIEEINSLIDEGLFLPPHIDFYKFCLEYLKQQY